MLHLHARKAALSIVIFAAITLLVLWLAYSYSLFEHNDGYLADYELSSGPIRIGDGAAQSSGIAFNQDTGQLYVIVNAPPQIHVLTAAGRHIRRIDLHGFDDTEGIAYLGHNRFAIVSERTGTISWFKLDQDTQSVRFDPQQSVQLFPRPVGNTGLEGISYAAGLDRLYTVKERNPRKIFALAWPVKDRRHPVITIPWDAETKSVWYTLSLSGLHYAPETGHLFILSRRSRSIVEYTTAGERVGHFSLKGGSGGLQAAIRKAEGIAISSDGTLYICAEPNQLYIFKPVTGRVEARPGLAGSE